MAAGACSLVRMNPEPARLAAGDTQRPGRSTAPEFTLRPIFDNGQVSAWRGILQWLGHGRAVLIYNGPLLARSGARAQVPQCARKTAQSPENCHFAVATWRYAPISRSIHMVIVRAYLEGV